MRRSNRMGVYFHDMDNDSAIGRLRQGASSFANRADEFFLSDELRNQNIKALANTRMGLIACGALGLTILIAIPTQMGPWSLEFLLSFSLFGVVSLGLPVALRQTNAMRHLGQFVCLTIATTALLLMWSSAGQATGSFPMLPMLPMVALIVGGRRSGILWGLVAIGILFFGENLPTSAAVAQAGYEGPSQAAHYAFVLVCILAMIGITVAFDTAWSRTAREHTERAEVIREAGEERYRKLLENASEGIFVADANGRIKFATPAAERLIGIESGEAIGKYMRSFTTPEEVSRVAANWNRVRTTVDAVERIQIKVSGKEFDPEPADMRTFELTMSNRTANQAIDGIVVHLRDVTNLRHAEANYETLVERSLQGIAVECRGEVVYANQALADLFGVDREQLLRTKNLQAYQRIHRDDADSVRSAFARSERESVEPIEIRLKHSDGEWRSLQMRWSDSIWEGRPARQILYVDVTAQKELDARREREHDRLEVRILERTRELEESQQVVRKKERLAAIGTLAAGIAHQINNPVGAILNSAEFATLVDRDEEGERIRDQAFSEIQSQAVRCGKIVRSILQFSRAEPTEKWSSDLAGVLRIAVDVTKRYALERDAEIQLGISPEIGERAVWMNPIEIEQVFVNLIRNAIEAQPSNAKVRIRAMISPDSAEAVEVIVEDDGPGVGIEDEVRIFEPFYTTRLSEGGSGLGLSVAHGIIEDHAGRMWVENRSENDPQGTRFHVLLPLEKSTNERTRGSAS